MADDPRTKNTHRAVLECCYPPGMTPIAGGSEAFCTSAMEAWLSSHPLPQWTNAYVVRVEAETQCEPGVGVYTVPVDSPDPLRALLADEDRAVELIARAGFDNTYGASAWDGFTESFRHCRRGEALAVLAALREVAGL